MPSFFRLVWAVMIAIVLLNLVVVGVVWLKWGQEPKIEDESLLFQTISGPILEYPVGGFTSGIFANSNPTLHSILENLDKAARDDRISGVVLRLGHAGGGFAMLEEIRAELLRVREAGKPVWAWSDNFNLKDLYIASACDSFFVHPGSYVALHGVYGERYYLANMMEKLGIEPEIHRIENYKSAAEMMTRSDMSPEAREMSVWIMNDIYPRVMWETAEGMGVDVGVLEEAMKQVIPMPDELEEMGLVSGVRYWDEMKDALPHPKGKEEPRFLSASTYDGVSPEDVGQKGKKKIAVVHAQGIIGGSESGRDPFLGVMMGHASVRRDLKKALDDEDVVGVVFRVDSRGGETLTSERIGRMVEIVDREKPVVISMVDVAASGGYTISYRGRTLLANRNTITGSIGSITGKMNTAGLFNKLGITFDGVGIGPNPDFYSATRSWTPEEYAIMSAEHWEGYHRWIRSIAEFREMDPADVDSLARGRVWTGKQAEENMLIDGLGDLKTAIATVKESAEMDVDEEVTLVHLPKPEGFLSQLIGMNVSTAPQTLFNQWMSSRVETMGRLEQGRWSLMDGVVP